MQAAKILLKMAPTMALSIRMVPAEHRDSSKASSEMDVRGPGTNKARRTLRIAKMPRAVTMSLTG